MKPDPVLLGFVALVAILAVLIALFLQPASGPEEKPKLQATFTITSADQLARQECIMLCKEKQQELDLSRGPCLSGSIIDDWVCDVAHDPREAVDDDPANQCPEFGDTASHFVEVSPECNFIRQF